MRAPSSQIGWNCRIVVLGMRGRTVLVTNASADAAVISIESLDSAGCRILASDQFRLPFGLRSRRCPPVKVLPSRTREEYEGALVSLIEAVQPDVLLPLSTWSVLAASRWRDRLAMRTAMLVPPFGSFLRAYDKRACMEECGRLGIPHPRTLAMEEACRRLEKMGEDAKVVIKPAVDVGAAAGVHYAETGDQLRKAVASVERRYGGALVQEYIPGGADAMSTVVLLWTNETRLAAAFTVRKIRQWPSSGGITAAGESTADRRLIDLVAPFFQAAAWRGPAEVELKRDPRDGIHKVIEINPRVPGYLRFVVGSGLDFPAMIVRLALGDSSVDLVEFPGYRVGTKYVDPGFFLLSVLSDLRGSRSVSGALRRARQDLAGSGPLVRSYLSDPRPIIGRILLNPRRSVGRTRL